MNPEAIEWLESLDEWVRLDLFKPYIGTPGQLFGVKEDHEPCAMCPQAQRRGGPGLLVIG